MKAFRKIRKLSLLAFLSVTIFILSCEKEHVPVSYKVLSSKTLKEGLEFPGGLSENPDQNPGLKGLTRIAKWANNFEGILVEGPSFQNFYSDGGIQGLRNSKILRFSDKESDDVFDLSEIAQIDVNTFFKDFDSYGYYPVSAGNIPDTLWRAKGLTLDGLILNDGTILVSSNSSDKLFNVSKEGVSLFQEPKLYGIIDMILGSDSKIYALKIDSVKSYAKEVISIENETIKTEFELPQGSINLGNEAQFIEKLKIVENSPLGKEKFGTEFYVSDLLKNIIYKVNANYDIEILSENLNYPSSLTVDSYGNVFYTTTPIIVDYSKLSRATKLCLISPETGLSKEIYTFNENLSDYYPAGVIWNSSSTSGLFPLDGNGPLNRNFIPIGYNVTTILKERGDSLDFLVTNSHQGTLKYVSIIREGGK